MIVLLEEILRWMPDYTTGRDRVVRYPTIPLINGYVAMPASFSPGERLLEGFDEHLPVRSVGAVAL